MIKMVFFIVFDSYDFEHLHKNRDISIYSNKSVEKYIRCKKIENSIVSYVLIHYVCLAFNSLNGGSQV